MVNSQPLQYLITKPTTSFFITNFYWKAKPNNTLTFWFRKFNLGVTEPDIAEHLVVHRMRQYC